MPNYTPIEEDPFSSTPSVGDHKFTQVEENPFGPPEEPSYSSKLGAAGKVGFKSGLAGAMKMYEIPSRPILEATGLGAPGTFASEQLTPTPEEEEAGSKAGIPGEIVKGVAGLPGAFAKYGPLMAVAPAGIVGTGLTFAGEKAAEELAAGKIPSPIELGEEAVIGGIFRGIEPLKRLARSAILAGTFSTQAFGETLAQTGDVGLAIKNAVAPGVIGAGLGAMGKGREKGRPVPEPEAKPVEEPLRIPRMPESGYQMGSSGYPRPKELPYPIVPYSTGGPMVDTGEFFGYRTVPPRPEPTRGIRWTPTGTPPSTDPGWMREGREIPPPQYPPVPFEAKAPGFAPRAEITPAPTVTPPEGIKPQKPPVAAATDRQMATVMEESAKIGGLSVDLIKRWTGLGNKKANAILEGLVESGEVEASLPGDPFPWRLKGVEPTAEIAALPPKLPGDILRYAPIIRELRELVNIGEPGLKKGVETKIYGKPETVSWSSTYPNFMRNKGWTKVQVLQTIDKGLKGEELGARQQKIWDTVKKEAKGIFRDRLEEQKKGRIENIPTGDLNVGDKVKVRGEILEVTEKNAEKIVIKDGQELTLDPYFDTIQGRKILPKEVKIPEVEGIKYDGIQDLSSIGEPNQYQFTDLKTKSTFSLPANELTKENIEANRERIRKAFEKPPLSPTQKGGQLLPGMKVGLEMKGAKEGVEPTLEGTPLGEAARKAEFERVQQKIPFGIGDKVTGITEQGEFNGQVAEINLDGTVMIGAPDGRMVQLPVDKVKLPGRLPAVMADGEILIGSGTHGSIPPERYSEAKDIKVGWVDTEGNFLENKPSRVEVDPLRTFIESKGVDFDKLTDKQKERWKGEFEKAEKETAKFANRPLKTSEEAQKAIDDKIDELVAKGMSIDKASDTPEVQKLYKIRDEIDRKDLSEWRNIVIKDTGLPEGQVMGALKQLGMGEREGSDLAVSLTAKSLREWGRDVLLNLESLYNYFSMEPKEGRPGLDIERTFAEFRWGGTSDNPVLQGSLIEGREFGWNKEALRKTEMVFNAISKTQGQEPIDLSIIRKKEIGENIQFALGKKSGTSLELETFKNISDNYSKENSPSKRIIERPEEIPERILSQLPEEQRSNIQGVYDPVEGVTYLVRKNIGSEANLKEIIDHEDIKHFALNTYLSKEADKWFERVYLKYGRSGLKDIAEERGFDLSTKEGRIKAAKEKIARTSIDEPGPIKQFWAWIREQIAKIFPNMKVSDAEIQRNIKLATEAMERGDLIGAERSESVEFATKLPPEEQRIQDKILIKIRDTRPLGTKIRDAWDSFYTNYVSEWWPLEKKDPVSGARIRLANAKGYGIAQTALEKGVPDINQNIGQPLNFVGEGFRQVLTPVVEAKELQNFIRYGVSKRAIEKYHQGVETGFDYNDSVFTVNKYEMKMIGDQTYRQIFDKLGIYQDNILKYYRDSGMLSMEAYNNIKAKNLMYFPFYRALEEMGPEGVGKGSQAIRALKRMKGGEQPLLDPIDSIVKNTYNLIMNAEKNMALREFANRSPNLATEIKPGMPEYSVHRHSVSLYEMRKNPFFQGILEEANLGKFDPQGNFRLNRGVKPQLEEEVVGIFRPNFIKGKEDIFIVYENGKPRIFKTEPDIGRALHGFDRESVSSIMKILSYPTKLLRAGAILSPEFMVRNPFRDMFSAMVYAKYGFYPWDFFKGIVEFGKKGPDYYRWLQNGGSLSSFVSLDRTDLRSTAQQVLNRKKLQGVISGDDYRSIMSNMIKSPIEALRTITELSEMGTRLGIYMRALKKGAPEAEAIMQSRESTLDFARSGAKGRAVNMLVAFWNANVQGLDKLRRELNFINPESRSRAIRNFAKATMMITVPSLLLAWANQDDPRYQELPEWQKALFWVIPTEKHLWRIPKPFELGMIFGTVPEYIMRWLRTNDPDTFKNIGNALTAGSMPGVVPTAVLPFVENWANKSFFTGRPIVPRGKEALKPEYQYQPYTTETAKWIGRQLSALPIIGDQIASPAKIENFVRGWSGGLGGHALKILDEGLVSSGIAPEEIKPSRSLSDIPIIKAFVARYPGTDTSSLQKFYESYNEVTSLRSSINSLRKQGKADEANLLLNANRKKINYYHAANSTHHAISNLKSSIDKIYSNPNIGSQEKRRLIEQIYLRMIAISKNFNERIGKNPWAGLESSLPYLNLSGALSVWENATPEEKERIAPEVLKKMREGKGG